MKIKKVFSSLLLLVMCISVSYAYRFASDWWSTGDNFIYIGGKNNQLGSPLRSKTVYGEQSFVVRESVYGLALSPRPVTARIRWRNGYGNEGNCTKYVSIGMNTKLVSGKEWQLDKSSSTYSSPYDTSSNAADAKDYYLQIYSNHGGDEIKADWSLIN